MRHDTEYRARGNGPQAGGRRFEAVLFDYGGVLSRLRGSGLPHGDGDNTVRELDRWREHARCDELFDVVAVSWELGMRKPDPAIFERTLDRLGVEPARAVYLDDFPPHVTAAEELGMTGIAVTDIDLMIGR